MSEQARSVSEPSSQADEDSSPVIDPASDTASKAQRILSETVAQMNGQPRSGQQAMVRAVSEAFDNSVTTLVQAGTGTGKSLGYLAPGLAWAMDNSECVVVATATLALQTQLATKDIPSIVPAVEKVMGRSPRTQILKGRSNYPCLRKIHEATVENTDSLLSDEQVTSAATGTGRQVLALRKWALEHVNKKTAPIIDQDSAPAHNPKAWEEVSSTSQQCVGAKNCDYAEQCFAERARAVARTADLVITNHALLAINAVCGRSALPDYGALVIDEAHELTDRITSAVSNELTVAAVRRLAKDAYAWIDDACNDELNSAIDDWESLMETLQAGRIEADSHQELLEVIGVLRAAARTAVKNLAPHDGDPDPDQVSAHTQMQDLVDTCSTLVALDANNVAWVSIDRYGDRYITVAPLSVAGLVREALIADSSTVFTSATLMLGGDFRSTAQTFGLNPGDQIRNDVPERVEDGLWRGIDVGSPFDYSKQGIIFIDTQLPAPQHQGTPEIFYTHMIELVRASQGHALILCTSQRAADNASLRLRAALPDLAVLCQGEKHLAELTRAFIDDDSSVLVGTRSLWQGLDAPGTTCRLVIIDRLPFPRPDDPLMKARQQAVESAGGNGFMKVAVTSSALLLAQGAGRLIRRTCDRGVVAILDPRLVTKSYGSFLVKSLPSMWRTTNRQIVIDALSRLAAQDR